VAKGKSLFGDQYKCLFLTNSSIFVERYGNTPTELAHINTMDIFCRTPRELKRKLKAFQQLDPVSTPYRKILEIINKELFVPVTVAKIHAGQYVERVRIMNNPDDIFTKKADLSYITDTSKITTFGRANPPGKAMFYGAVKSTMVSSPRIVALAETEEALQGVNKGITDKKLIMTVGKWVVKKDLIVSEMVFKKDAIDNIPEVKRAFDQHSREIMARHPLPEAKQSLALLEFFSEAMAKRTLTNADYKISAAFTESILKTGQFDGIMFQSVQTDFEGTNVALTPKAVDESLYLEEALVVAAEIRGKRVFLDNLARTGIFQPDQQEFGWALMEATPEEEIEHFFATGELPKSKD